MWLSSLLLPRVSHKATGKVSAEFHLGDISRPGSAIWLLEGFSYLWILEVRRSWTGSLSDHWPEAALSYSPLVLCGAAYHVADGFIRMSNWEPEMTSSISSYKFLWHSLIPLLFALFSLLEANHDTEPSHKRRGSHKGMNASALRFKNSFKRDCGKIHFNCYPP